MDLALSAARLYAAGLLLLGTDRYEEVTAHSVAGLAGCLALALFVSAALLQPALQRPYYRLSALAAAVCGGAAVYVLLAQWRDPDVYSWIAAPLSASTRRKSPVGSRCTCGSKPQQPA